MSLSSSLNLPDAMKHFSWCNEAHNILIYSSFAYDTINDDILRQIVLLYWYFLYIKLVILRWVKNKVNRIVPLLIDLFLSIIHFFKFLFINPFWYSRIEIYFMRYRSLRLLVDFNRIDHLNDGKNDLSRFVFCTEKRCWKQHNITK